MLNIKPATVFPTSDGELHQSRSAAVAHEKTIVRQKRVGDAMLDGSIECPDLDFPTSGAKLSVADFIARNGEKLLQLLTVKEARGPRKAKVMLPVVPTSANAPI